MKQMSVVSLYNILSSNVEEDEVRDATQEDIDNF